MDSNRVRRYWTCTRNRIYNLICYQNLIYAPKEIHYDSHRSKPFPACLYSHERNWFYNHFEWKAFNFHTFAQKLIIHWSRAIARPKETFRIGHVAGITLNEFYFSILFLHRTHPGIIISWSDQRKWNIRRNSTIDQSRFDESLWFSYHQEGQPRCALRNRIGQQFRCIESNKNPQLWKTHHLSIRNCCCIVRWHTIEKVCRSISLYSIHILMCKLSRGAVHGLRFVGKNVEIHFLDLRKMYWVFTAHIDNSTHTILREYISRHNSDLCVWMHMRVYRCNTMEIT